MGRCGEREALPLAPRTGTFKSNLREISVRSFFLPQ